MQMRVSEACYRTWLADTEALSWSGGVLVVGAPTAFVAEMLERRLFELVLDSVKRVSGDDVAVQVEVAGPAKAEAPPRQEMTSHPASVVPEVRLNPRYTFDTFIVGSSNELANAAAAAVAERPGSVYNPLFIYSAVGLGKTHLLSAVGHRLAEIGLSAIYASTEEFTNQYIAAIRAGETEAFRARYRGAEVLLLDDIQFLIGKEQTQEGFFHTFNSLHMSGRQVVVTCDRPASALDLLQDRVCSRLSGGLVVDIQPPGQETRLAILRSKADLIGSRARITAGALEVLAEMEHRNVRELEGSLNRAVAYAELTGGQVTSESISMIAESLPRPERAPLTAQGVLDAVAAHFAVECSDLAGRRRDARITLARHVAMYLLREDAQMALSVIGKELGGRDHSTILHGCRRIAGLVNGGNPVRGDLVSLRQRLASQRPRPAAGHLRRA